MIYYHVSGSVGNYSIFTRSDTHKYPFHSSLFNHGGSSNNVRSWKTLDGVHRFVKKNYPDWVHETTQEFRARKDASV